MQNLIDSVIGLTFAKNNRHDFFSALAQVLMSKYSNNIRWIRCEGWNDNNVFGIVIPKLRNKGYEERETLSFYKCKFSFFIGHTNGSDRVKSKIKKFFVYLNEQFSSNTICRHLMLDWFWNLMLLSKGKITELKQILTECEENIIREIVDRLIVQNSYHENNYNVQEKQLLKSIEELCSKYYEYFGKDKDFRVLLKEYLCGDGKESTKSYNQRKPGKLFYQRSIEKVVKRNDTIIKQLRDLEDQNIKKKYEHFLFEDNVFLDIRSRFYDLFCIYLENESHPYFFIYNPFNRHFYYRGLVADLDHIVMPEELDELKDIREQVASGLQIVGEDIGKDHQSDDYLILFVESVGQPFDEDLIRYLFVGRKPLWIENFYDDFDVPPISDKRRYIEQKILQIFGNKKTCSFFFAPLICDGQYRGNLYVRVDENKEIFTKLKSVMPILSNYCSQKIEDYYYQQFMRETLKGDTPTFKLILDKLPYLLNIEAAGYIPIKKNAGVDGNEPFQCSNYTKGNKRGCEIWGFAGSGSYGNLNLAELECIGWKTKGRCLWAELYLESTRIGEKTKLIFFDISIYDLTHEIMRYCALEKKGQIDIRQSYDLVYSIDEAQQMLARDTDTSCHKVIFSWKLTNSREMYDYLIWFAIDLSPWVFNKVKSAIIAKIETIAEIKKVIEDRMEFFRAFEHDTSRFVRNIGLSQQLKDIIENRSNTIKFLLGEPIEVKGTKPKDQVKKDTRDLFNLIMGSQYKLISISIIVKTDISNLTYWFFIQTILLNLISNIKKWSEKTDANVIKVTIEERNGYLCLDFCQSGCINFDSTPEDIKVWLNGYYEKGSEKGLGYSIMQGITDRMKGNLTVEVKSDDKHYKVTKYRTENINNRRKNVEGDTSGLCHFFKLQIGND